MQTKESAGAARQVQIAGVEIELWEGGQGRPLLLLHAGDGFDADAPYVRALAAYYRVIAASHPGFGKSALAPHIKTVDDLSYFYLDLIESQKLTDLIVVGISFGAWIAAEIAVKNTSRIAGLCLTDTVGAKFADALTREIADLFSYPQYEQPQWLYHDEKLRAQTFGHLSDEVAAMLARNHESFCLYAWSPTLHSPRLAHRLHRIDVPTLLIWGAEDRVVPPEYGRKWQQAIPGAKLEIINNAGHYPQIEQPAVYVASIEGFVASLPAPGAKRN